ncbi:hypothetical protein Golomagni_03084 [Golovinomyces magnicellulatus]|nr:hypothetical protein Golomagni_03084 [Golovinomyces magnicellulatus]
MPITITVVGSLNTDFVTVTSRIPSGGETLTASSFFTGLGGKGANQAVACARLSRPNPSAKIPVNIIPDVRIKMVGAVGADDFGSHIVNSMASVNIDTSGVKVKEGQSTGVAVILVEESSGENRILLNPGANHTLNAKDFEQPSALGNPLPDLIILQLEIPLPTVLQILKTARKAGIDVLLNTAPAVKLPDEAYQGLAHLILNETEAMILTRRSLSDLNQPDFDWANVTNEFITKGVRNVIVTLGAKGALFASSENGQNISEHIPATRVEKVVDTTAAGDTFVGAYALGIVRGDEKLKILRNACLAAARTIEKKGAQDSIPWADELGYICLFPKPIL